LTDELFPLKTIPLVYKFYKIHKNELFYETSITMKPKPNMNITRKQTKTLHTNIPHETQKQNTLTN